ncbi:MAG: hypothetical protein H7834_14090 [Magnetococcus sp. YQC-9]
MTGSLQHVPETAVPEDSFIRNFCKRAFVRSQDEITFATGAAQGGRWMTGFEVWQLFENQAVASECLAEIEEFGSYVLTTNLAEPAASIKKQIDRLNISDEELAEKVLLSVEAIKTAKDPRQRLPIRILEKIAQEVNFDDRWLSLKNWESAGKRLNDEKFTTRLLDIRSSADLQSTQADSERRKCTLQVLCRASWTTRREAKLEQWLNATTSRNYVRELLQIDFDSEYGNSPEEAIQAGYRLANATRERLESLNLLPQDRQKRIAMTRLVSRQLRIPLILLPFDDVNIAGAAIVTGEDGERGIVINTNSANPLSSAAAGEEGSRSKWIRRFTIAHEFCHVTWDDDVHMNSIRNDRSSSIDSVYDKNELGRFLVSKSSDVAESDAWVELRANAFAIEFLAPRDGVVKTWLDNAEQKPIDRLKEVVATFGVCAEAARNHIYNALKEQEGVDLERVRSEIDATKNISEDDIQPNAFDEESPPWPFKDSELEKVPEARRGRFAWLVAQCYCNGLLSADSCRSYLGLDFLAPESIEDLAVSLDGYYEMKDAGLA